MFYEPAKGQFAFTGDYSIYLRKQFQDAVRRICGERAPADHCDQSGVRTLYFFYKIE
jgi:hypothetical protein